MTAMTILWVGLCVLVYSMLIGVFFYARGYMAAGRLGLQYALKLGKNQMSTDFAEMKTKFENMRLFGEI